MIINYMVKYIINYIINIELYFIKFIQTNITTKKAKLLIHCSNILTKKNKYLIYLFILFLKDINVFIRTYITIYLSRDINLRLKHSIQEKRPFNHSSNLVKVVDRRKYSYSFPSQSIQTYILLYLSSIASFPYLLTYIFFYTIFILLFITRIYRGLHYPHDFLASYTLAIILYKLVDSACISLNLHNLIFK